MISLLKRFLTKTEATGEKELELEEVEGWLQKVFNTTIDKDFEKIRNINEDILKNIEKLEKVDVKTKNVDERIKNVVNGNKIAYINAVRLFMEKINPPLKTNSESVKEFCDLFEREINVFNKKTIRNYFITKNLIGEELENITKLIKELDSTIKTIRRKLQSEKVELYETVIDSVKKIAKIKNEKKEGASVLEILNKEKSVLKKEKEQLLREQKVLEQSEDFLKLKRLKEEKENVNKLLLLKNNEIVNLFSPLQKAIKKMGKVENIQLIKIYSEDPCNALLEDEKLEIRTLLENLNKKIIQNEIDLKEEKKEKTLESLRRIKEDGLKKWKGSYLRIKNELDSISVTIKNNKIEPDLAALKSKIEEAERKLTETETKLNSIEKIDVIEEIKKIEAQLQGLTNSKIRVN